MENCANCRYWLKGRCHRWPPVGSETVKLDGDLARRAVWRRTDGDDWCGEWAAPEPAPTEPAPNAPEEE